MATEGFSPSNAEPWWYYHLKNAGSRIALTAAQAAYILSAAWPKDAKDWVLFSLLMLANLGGVAISINSAGKVALPK
jgi:hypothetical protein